MTPRLTLPAALLLATGAAQAAAPAAKAPPAPPASPLVEARVDRADIDRTTITGHKELPKVLYIVPWKKPLPGNVAARAHASVLDEALAPVDRDVFRRQLRYRAQLDSPITTADPQAPQEKSP